MKEKFYYLRKVKGIVHNDNFSLHRCGIVYLIKTDDGKIARGISLCNEVEDKFIRDSDYENYIIGGLDRAKGRAERALKKRCDSQVILRDEAKEKVKGLGIEFKSEYNPILNRFEEKMLEDRK